MEYDYFLQLLANYLPIDKYFNKDFQEWLRTQVDLDHYADLLVFTLPSPRIDWYSYSNIDDIAKGITSHANAIIEELGPLAVQTETPILEEM